MKANTHILISGAGESLTLPVNPSSVELVSSHNIAKFETVDSGEMSAIGRERLKTLTISSFFPRSYTPYCVVRDVLDPSRYIAMLEAMKRSNKPIRVLITGTAINHAFVIERFSHTYGHALGDVDYTLDLVEYKEFNIPRSSYSMPIIPEFLLRIRPIEVITRPTVTSTPKPVAVTQPSRPRVQAVTRQAPKPQPKPVAKRQPVTYSKGYLKNLTKNIDSGFVGAVSKSSPRKYQVKQTQYMENARKGFVNSNQYSEDPRTGFRM